MAKKNRASADPGFVSICACKKSKDLGRLGVCELCAAFDLP